MGRGIVYFWPSQCHILKTFRIIVGIYLPKRLIQYIHKTFKVIGLLVKLNDPFMSADLLTFKINRAGRIVFKYRCGSITSLADGLFRIVYNDFFSKSIDEMFRSSRNADAVRREACELNRIPDHIPPQSAVGTDDDRIVLMQLDRKSVV